jgi:hypothetical protein
MVRWGSSGLALLTTDGLIYLVQDAMFVSSSAASSQVRAANSEDIKMRWKQPTRPAIARALRHRGPFAVAPKPLTLTQLLAAAPHNH